MSIDSYDRLLRALLVGALVVMGCKKARDQEPTPAPSPQVASPDAPLAPQVAPASPPDAVTSGLPKAEIDKLAARLEAESEAAGFDWAKAIEPLTREQLVGLARLGPCHPAALAAERLGKLGDRSHLPHRPSPESPLAIARALCMIAALDDATARSYLRDYVPAKGTITITRDVCPGDDDKERSFTRDKLVGDELMGFGGVEYSCEKKDGLDVCAGLVSKSQPDTVYVTLKPGADGKLYIDALTFWNAIACH